MEAALLRGGTGSGSRGSHAYHVVQLAVYVHGMLHMPLKCSNSISGAADALKWKGYGYTSRVGTGVGMRWFFA